MIVSEQNIDYCFLSAMSLMVSSSIFCCCFFGSCMNLPCNVNILLYIYQFVKVVSCECLVNKRFSALTLNDMDVCYLKEIHFIQIFRNSIIFSVLLFVSICRITIYKGMSFLWCLTTLNTIVCICMYVENMESSPFYA